MPVEIGLIVAGRFSLSERRLLQQSEARFRQRLQAFLPEFDWQINVSRRRDIADGRREETTELLHHAAEERELYRWDYALLLIDAELQAHYRSFALAALSRPLDAAVIATTRLMPEQDGPGADHDLPDEQGIIERISTLLLRSVLHLAGLKPVKDPHNLLYRPGSPSDLAHMKALSHEQQAELVTNLSAIADQRLEEITRSRLSAGRFLLHASIINRTQILESIIAARPWQFPRRLSRLTTAAVSTVAVLLMSAESWHLALSQSWLGLAMISLTILVLTTSFIGSRQYLLLNRGNHHREQIAVTRVSAIGIVLSGLALTWLCMFALALLTNTLLFPATLIAQWTGISGGVSTIGATSYLKMAGFCASLGLLIGALGASFEEQTHFQHVIFVDDEL